MYTTVTTDLTGGECDGAGRRLGASGWQQNAIIKAIRADHVNLRTRLLSIEHDTQRALALYEHLIGKKSSTATGATTIDTTTTKCNVVEENESPTDSTGGQLECKGEAAIAFEVFDDIVEPQRKPLPIFGNARAGSWYVPLAEMMPYEVETCAFKSADGHYGHWAACPRRPNIHVLRALLLHGGVVVFDVTRSGKRIPDSLSKTVPIWCAVVTTLIRRPHCDNVDCDLTGVRCCDACRDAMDDALHVHPSIPPSETASIRQRLPFFVAAWRTAGMQAHPVLRAAAQSAKTWHQRRKNENRNGDEVSKDEAGFLHSSRRQRKDKQRRAFAIRALWTQPSRPTWPHGIPLEHLDFIPIVCMSASDAIEPGKRMLIDPDYLAANEHEQNEHYHDHAPTSSSRKSSTGAIATSTKVAGIVFPTRPSFSYVQGAGDDEEAWAHGLTPALFWKHRYEILMDSDSKHGGEPANDGNEGVVQTVTRLTMASTSSGSDGYSISTILSPIAVWESHISIAQLPKKSHFEEMLRSLKTYQHADIIVLLIGDAETVIMEKYLMDEEKHECDQHNDDDAKNSNTASKNRTHLPHIKHVSLTNNKGKTDHKYAFARVLGPCLSQLRECCVKQDKHALVACTSENGDWTAGLAIAWLAWHCDFVVDINENVIVEGCSHNGDSDDDDEDEDENRNEDDVDVDANDNVYDIIDDLTTKDNEEALYRLSTDPRDGIPVVDKQDVHKTMMHFLATFPRFQISRATLKQLNRFFSSPCPPSVVT